MREVGKLIVLEKYYRLIGGPKPNMVPTHGIVVKGADGNLYQLCKRSEYAKSPNIAESDRKLLEIKEKIKCQNIEEKEAEKLLIACAEKLTMQTTFHG